MVADRGLLRPARPGEAKALASLVNDAYGRTDAPSGWTSEDDILAGPRIREAGVRELLDGEDSLVLVAAEEGELVACAHVERLEPGLSEIGLLSVDPGRQAEGLGRRVLEASEARAVEDQGADRIVLKVIARREELVAWYERRGYERTGEEKRFEPDEKQRSLQGPLSFVVLEKARD